MSDPARLTAAQMAYDNEKKNGTPAWLLWVFLGMWGGHRYYLGNIGLGITMTALTIFGLATSLLIVGDFVLGAMFIWWIIDAILLNGNIRAFNARKQAEIFGRYGLAPNAGAYGYPSGPALGYPSPAPQQLPQQWQQQSPQQLPQQPSQQPVQYPSAGQPYPQQPPQQPPAQ